MLLPSHKSWESITTTLNHAFVTRAVPVNARSWQSQDISGKPEMRPIELLNVSVELNVPESRDALETIVMPNMPWAEEHFGERVSGIPYNPPPSHERWPFRRANNEEHTDAEGKFSHTYPERIWPKQAGMTPAQRATFLAMKGIRYPYGDLEDVVNLLKSDPATRQAFLPIWFPEDTGAISGQRVPCTLGYHFIQRDGKLHCVYYMRSCDYMRHFADDVYLAARLTQWMSQRILGKPGTLTMHITSLHVFSGDMPLLRSRIG